MPQPSQLPVVDLNYAGRLLADPRAANTMRYLIEWLQEGGVILQRGARAPGDAALRREARTALTAAGEDLATLHAGHPLDSVIDPLPTLEPGRRAVYLFIHQGVNTSFGSRLGNALRTAGITQPGTPFVLRFNNFPDYTVAPPRFADIPVWGE
jgi:hypothetical protein